MDVRSWDTGGCRPGERPPCWWLFEASQGRRVLGSERTARLTHQNDGEAVVWLGDDGKVYRSDQLEAERVYLDRLQLLTNEELRILNRQKQT